MRSALFLHNISPSSSWISPSKRYSSTSLRHIGFLIQYACFNGMNISRTGPPVALLSVTYSRKRTWNPLNISAQIVLFSVNSSLYKKMLPVVGSRYSSPFSSNNSKGGFLEEEIAFFLFF